MVRVKPSASGDAILPPAALLVRTTATPEGGKANQAILRLLAAALGLPVSTLEVLRGGSGRTEIVRIDQAGMIASC